MAEENKNLQNTLDEGKHLWGLVQQYAKLEMVDKLTFVLTILIVGGHRCFSSCSARVYK